MIYQHKNQTLANKKNSINDMNNLQYMHQNDINNIYPYNGQNFPNNNYDYPKNNYDYNYNYD